MQYFDGKLYGKSTCDNAFRSYVRNSVMWCKMNQWQAMVNILMNSHIMQELLNSMSTGAAVDFAPKSDLCSLLFLMILMNRMEITHKTGAV